MRGRPGDDADEGFTLVEVVVSLGILTMIMTSMTVFMIGSRRAGRYASLRDTAVQLAVEGMERARGVRGSALLGGRALCGACAGVVSAEVTSMLGTGVARWDAAGTGTLGVPQPGAQPDGTVVASPADPEVVQLDAVSFKRYYYVGACWQPTVAGSTTGLACGSTTAAAPLVRLVVAVSWPQSGCAGGVCTYATAGLFSTAVTDPFLVGG
ncbi:type IV pilus modification PilV family protein [Actinoplanes sp. CA-030573]|uniref:type IV pilus modification PilV family protein n=1 Tax=Actinoplanes sp. CA-030573 TaxID=3239898 RepID=UPI003D90DDB1